MYHVRCGLARGGTEICVASLKPCWQKTLRLPDGELDRAACKSVVFPLIVSTVVADDTLRLLVGAVSTQTRIPTGHITHTCGGIPLQKIHPLAVVSSESHLGCNVTVDPFAIIESNVVVGDDCRIASHAIVKQGTTLGSGNLVCESAVIGGLPQHTSCPSVVGQLVIGDANMFREHTTVHRSLHEGSQTRIGNNNLLMVGAHVAHDCVIGDHVILTNGVQLAGHVEVQDKAFVSAGVGVHQHARIGRMAMVGGHARIVQDVLPYVTVDGGSSAIVGLNLIGLRRGGFTSEQIAQLKAAYRVIYREGHTWREVTDVLKEKFPTGLAAEFHEFMENGRRGFTPERRTPPGATVRLHRSGEGSSENKTPQPERRAA